MEEYSDVSALITRVRNGDASAAEELVHRYEPELKAEIRRYLRQGPVRRVVDSQDICQSVFASLFIRLSLGEYDLDGSDNLVKLLMRMARNKTNAQIRHEFADRRDIRRTARLEDVEEGKALVDRERTPSQKIEMAELLKTARSLLSGPEKWTAEQRASGQSWEQIASATREKTDTVRKRFGRAIDRVRRELIDDF